MNPATPLRASLVHDQWTETMKIVATTHSDPTARELATFASEILARCGDTPELTEYLGRRALSAMEAQ